MTQEIPPAAPSPPRAPRWARLLVYVILLLIAIAAIWWIDRGAMLTNTAPAATRPDKRAG